MLGFGQMLMSGGLLLTSTATLTTTDSFGSPTLSNGNLTVSGSSFRVRANILNTVGKFYFENTYTTLGSSSGGVGVIKQGGSATWGDGASGVSYRADNGTVTKDDGTVLATLSTSSNGATVGIVIDLSSRVMWIRLGGTFSGDPVAGTGGISISSISGQAAPLVTTNINALTATCNFGATSFVYSIPVSCYPGYGSI